MNAPRPIPAETAERMVRTVRPEWRVRSAERLTGGYHPVVDLWAETPSGRGGSS